MLEISFTASKADQILIKKIAKRALKLAPEDELLHHIMNITACHANGCALRLQELLETDDFNFTHDICGIDLHIDRETGKLTNNFLPRFAA